MNLSKQTVQTLAIISTLASICVAAFTIWHIVKTHQENKEEKLKAASNDL